jgi:hypothetical protein
MVQNTETETRAAKKKSFWGKFGTFLIMGGWMLVLFLVLGIYILVSVLAS